MVTALYRINGGEVIKISEIDRSWPDADANFYAVMVDPALPDGSLLREVLPISPGSARYGPRRQLGFAKIAISATNTIRNATQEEIDFFDDAEGQDGQAEDAIQAREQVVKHPFIARVLMALIRRLVDNVNQQNAKANAVITQWESFKDAMANENLTITQIRSGVASLPEIVADLPDSLTAGQVANVLRNDIQEGDAPRRGA